MLSCHLSSETRKFPVLQNSRKLVLFCTWTEAHPSCQNLAGLGYSSYLNLLGIPSLSAASPLLPQKLSLSVREFICNIGARKKKEVISLEEVPLFVIKTVIRALARKQGTQTHFFPLKKQIQNSILDLTRKYPSHQVWKYFGRGVLKKKRVEYLLSCMD